MNQCPYCTQEYICEVLEAWAESSRYTVQLDTCCELAYQEWLDEFQNLSPSYGGLYSVSERAVRPLKEVSGVKKIYRDLGGDVWDFGVRIETTIPQREVKEFITKHHRHLNASLGDKFRAVALNGSVVIGAAMMGRPVSRHLDDGTCLEITRVAIDSSISRALTQNICSQLYAKCFKWAKQHDYQSVITYTLEHEDGASLKSANFIHEYTQPNSRRGSSWDSPSRTRNDKTPNCPKKRWRKYL
jgi:hypothetical protein